MSALLSSSTYHADELHRTVIPSILWAALGVLAAARLATFGHLLIRKGPIGGATFLTSGLYRGATDAQRRQAHQGIAEQTDRLVDTAIVVGALALGAWAALFVVADSAPSDQLTPAGRNLLLVGAAVLIIPRALFRVPDRYMTFLARDASLYLGLSSVGLAFAAFAADLLHGWPGVALALTGAAALTARDVYASLSGIAEFHQETRPNARAAAQQEQPPEPPALRRPAQPEHPNQQELAGQSEHVQDEPKP